MSKEPTKLGSSREKERYKYSKMFHINIIYFFLLLTIQQFGVVFDGALEIGLLATVCQIVQIRAKDDRVSLGKFRIGAGIL